MLNMHKLNSNDEKVELSLIIDDDTSTVVELNLKNISDEEIMKICSSICVKYELPTTIRKRLFNHIQKEINQMRKDRDLVEQKEQRKEKLINRLYYDSLEHKNKKQMHLESIKKDKLESMLNKYSFTPKINKNSEFYSNRNYFRIEDRLYYEHKQLQEKKNYERFLDDMEKKEKSASKVKVSPIKKSLKRCHSNNNLKKGIKNEFRKFDTFGKNETINKRKDFYDNVVPDVKKPLALRTILESDSNAENHLGLKNPNLKQDYIVNIAEKFDDISILQETPAFTTKKNNTISKISNLQIEKSNSLINYPPELMITPNSVNSKLTTNTFGINFYKTLGASSVDSSVAAGGNTINNTPNAQNNQNNMNLNTNYATNNRLTKQISFNARSSFNNANSNSYSEKYEKLLSQKNLQNSNSITQTNQQTPMMTHTPTPKNLENIIFKENPNTKNILNEERNQNYNQSISIQDRELSPKNKNDSFLFKFDNAESVKSPQKFNKRSQTTNKNKINHMKNKSLDYKRNRLTETPSPGKCYDRLYRTNEENQNRKQEALARLIKNEYSFQPKLTKETKNILSRIRKPENKDTFLGRMMNSKKVSSLAPKNRIVEFSKSFTNSRSRSKSQSSKNLLINNANNITNSPNPMSIYLKKSLRNEKSSLGTGNKTIPNLTSSHNFTSAEIQSQSPKYLLTTTNDTNRHDDKKRIRDLKSEKSLYGHLNKIKTEKKKTNKIFQEKFNENISKFMLNNLKELYEAFNKNGQNFEIEGVPLHIRDRLLIPTCSIIKNRGLEFNFQNFYTIANEIFNNFF